jgi:hypothetical protein
MCGLCSIGEDSVECLCVLFNGASVVVDMINEGLAKFPGI